jgi:thiamine biosynthesis protein ThiI
MEKIAQKFNYEVLDQAVEHAQHLNIDEIEADISAQAPVEVVSDIQGKKYTVIDIRPEEECIELPCQTLKIPFHKLKKEFKNLPKDKEYLLYCDKGIMSQLHAQYLRDANEAENVKVYRPKEA